MSFSKGLAVSLPACELRNLVLPGSLFDPRDLIGQPISGTLRVALRLLAEQCDIHGQRLILVARPEIFTHGETLAWLMRELGEVDDHVAVSDGSTIQLIPGLRNHLFFYNPSLSRNLAALDQFVSRAPEVPLQLGCQVNTCFTFRQATSCCTPPPLLLQANRFVLAGEAEYRKFYVNFHSVPDSVARLDAAPALGADDLAGFLDVELIPFTNAACQDMAFCRAVAGRILSIMRFPAKLLILGAPLAHSADDSFSNMISLLLTGLIRCGTLLPRATLQNVVIASNLPDAAYFSASHRRSSLLLHETFEFWRLPPAYYENFVVIDVALSEEYRRDGGGFLSLLQKACGRSLNVLPGNVPRKASIRSLALQ